MSLPKKQETRKTILFDDFSFLPGCQYSWEQYNIFIQCVLCDSISTLDDVSVKLWDKFTNLDICCSREVTATYDLIKNDKTMTMYLGFSLDQDEPNLDCKVNLFTNKKDYAWKFKTKNELLSGAKNINDIVKNYFN